MEKIILEQSMQLMILLEDVGGDEPIFAVRDGIVIGMLIKGYDGNWRLMTEVCESKGYCLTREEAMRAESGLDFYIKPKIKLA